MHPPPLVLEIHLRCRLTELSRAAGAPVTLANLPDTELDAWQQPGTTHVWLMGAWTSGPRSRAVYLRHPQTPAHLQEALPDWTEADVIGSPYAIGDYQVPAALGGDAGLAALRERLRARGLGLMLDFVPNHLGLDHPWLARHPDYFVQGAGPADDCFRQETDHGPRWLAHGKDPWFPPWIDTAQLDHRRADTRAAVIAQLRSVTGRCDAVRCDMTMLLLTEVFARNWGRYPVAPGAPGVDTEFWADALAAVRRPGLLFMGEAYWDLEDRLQDLGFDYTYDKRVLDLLVERRPADLIAHLFGKGDAFVRRSAHFLENHDEPCIAPRLSLPEHRAAAWLQLSLPGMRLLHEGQLTGARTRVPIHLARRRPAESERDATVSAVYAALLEVLRNSVVGRGEGSVLRPEPAAPGDETHRTLAAIEWTAPNRPAELALVNLGAEPARARLRPASSASGWQTVTVPAAAGLEAVRVTSPDDAQFTVELPPHGLGLLRCK